MKIYECKICKRNNARRPTKYPRFRGTRKDVRLHLRNEHLIRGLNYRNSTKDNTFRSRLTSETESTTI